MPENSFRNPYTPQDGEVFTPTEYLQRTLDFAVWSMRNPWKHQAFCYHDPKYHQLFLYGICCEENAQRFIDHTIFNLAGLQTGLFESADDLTLKLLELAKERLAELQNGVDDVETWDQKITEIEFVFRNKGRTSDLGFSLCSFIEACYYHGFSPEMVKLAEAFGFTVAEATEAWEDAY